MAAPTIRTEKTVLHYNAGVPETRKTVLHYQHFAGVQETQYYLEQEPAFFFSNVRTEVFVPKLIAGLPRRHQRPCPPRTPFESIPQSFWWCIVTYTTVGYGDMAPVTVIGQMIGCCTMITGLLILAMPISVLSSNFGEVRLLSSNFGEV